MKAFFRELRQRSIVKVAIAYMVIAWLVLQLADMSPDHDHPRYRAVVESLAD